MGVGAPRISVIIAREMRPKIVLLYNTGSANGKVRIASLTRPNDPRESESDCENRVIRVAAEDASLVKRLLV